MTETCMKSKIVDSVKTTAQIKYENKMNRYIANRERKMEKAIKKIKFRKQKQTKIKRGTNYVEAEIRNPFFIYAFKITNIRTKHIYYKVGKADKPLKRIGEWVTGINKKLGKDLLELNL